MPYGPTKLKRDEAGAEFPLDPVDSIDWFEHKKRRQTAREATLSFPVFTKQHSWCRAFSSPRGR